MHRILERQIKHSLGDLKLEEISNEWKTFLIAVSDTYTHGDQDRALLDNSLELSSKEFVIINKKLKEENIIIEQKVEERTKDLDQEKTKLKKILESMTTGVLFLDNNGVFSFANNAILRILGVEDVSATMDTFLQFFSSISSPEYINKALVGESINIYEVEVKSKIYSVLFEPLEIETGVFGVLIWINDVTEQKLLDRSKNQFIAIASHEMRTPLAIIRGNAELLLDDEIIKQNTEQKEGIKSILKNSIRLLGIVNDFLNVQNMEENKKLPKKEEVNIAEILQNVINDCQPMKVTKGLYIVADSSFTLEMPIFIIDHEYLQQIAINLISNAIHYTKKGGITLSLEKHADSINVLFTDTGVGISPEDQLVLFKKFGTGKSFMKTKEYGSGLGLYISSFLAEKIGASLVLQKSEIDVGSTFCLTLPLTLAK